MSESQMAKMRGFSGILCISALSSCFAALPPDPENAALLYYQAFLLCSEPNDATRHLMEAVSYGRELNEQLREYVRSPECRQAIQYAEKAAQLRNCDWGPWYSLGFSDPSPHLKSARFFACVLHLDARVLAADGQYRAAFERCLTMRKLARHIDTQNPFSYALATGAEFSAQRCISQILGSMPPDVETITWLKSQLASVPPVSRSITRAAQMDLESALQTAEANDRMKKLLRGDLVEAAGSNSVTDIRNVLSEELLKRTRRSYMEFLDSALQVVDSGLPYEKTYAEIERLREGLNEEPNNPMVGQLAGILSMPSLYSVQVLYDARLAAFSVALELYLGKAKTGRLPSQLPPGLPKDAYSGEDFIYTITEDGFTLRSRVRPVDGRETLRLEYNIP